jgi:hypothetical protein
MRAARRHPRCARAEHSNHRAPGKGTAAMGDLDLNDLARQAETREDNQPFMPAHGFTAGRHAFQLDDHADILRALVAFDR